MAGGGARLVFGEEFRILNYNEVSRSHMLFRASCLKTHYPEKTLSADLAILFIINPNRVLTESNSKSPPIPLYDIFNRSVRLATLFGDMTKVVFLVCEKRSRHQGGKKMNAAIPILIQVVKGQVVKGLERTRDVSSFWGAKD